VDGPIRSLFSLLNIARAIFSLYFVFVFEIKNREKKNLFLLNFILGECFLGRAAMGGLYMFLRKFKRTA
jgi:hypothetical protein